MNYGIRVTVVILSHRPHMVAEAFRSVTEQTYYKNHPGTIQILVQHCQEYYYGKLNEIASIAQGEYIVILCDDDMLAPTFLEELLAVVDVAKPTPDILYTDRIVWTDKGPRRWWQPWTWRRERPGEGIDFKHWGPLYTADKLAAAAKAQGVPNKGYYWTQVPPLHFATGHWLPMTCMIRRGFWNELRGYNESISHADTEFWYRVAKAEAHIAYVPRSIFWYHRHPEQFSNVVPSVENAMREFSRAHFDDFGLMWECAEEIEGTGTFKVPLIPEHLRQMTREYLRSLEKDEAA